MIDYLMVFGLLVLLVVLSLPTTIQLAGILGDSGAKSRRASFLKTTDTHASHVPSALRMTSTRVQPATGDRAVAEPRLAH